MGLRSVRPNIGHWLGGESGESKGRGDEMSKLFYSCKEMFYTCKIFFSKCSKNKM